MTIYVNMMTPVVDGVWNKKENMSTPTPLENAGTSPDTAVRLQAKYTLGQKPWDFSVVHIKIPGISWNFWMSTPTEMVLIGPES